MPANLPFRDDPTPHAVADGARMLAETADALHGHYEASESWGPCGRLDAVLEGVEVVARAVVAEPGARLRTFVRAYAAHPVFDHVALRGRTLRGRLLAWLARAPRTGDPLLDRALVASEGRRGRIEAFLDERLRAALRRLLDVASIEELSYAYGYVKLLVRGVPRDPHGLDAVLDLAVAAARWRDHSGPYR